MVGPPNNEQVGRDTGSSQLGEVGLAHPQATCLSPKLFLLLACLEFPLRDNIPKKFFFGSY
jgi:hypothetical protein